MNSVLYYAKYILIECPKGTYGPECLNICYCTVYKKCDRRTGECKKCKEKPCEDDEGGDDNYYKSTVSTKGSYFFH